MGDPGPLGQREVGAQLQERDDRIPPDRRLYGTIFAGAFVLLVAVCFWIYHPIYVGDSIPYTEWFHRMLLGNRWV